MQKKSILLVLICLIVLPFATAGKVPTSPQYGLQINSWEVNSIKQNENYTFIWDVSDAEGMLLKANTTQCSFVNFPDGKLGKVISGLGSITADGNGFYFNIDGKNLSVLGKYNYQIDCYLLSNMTISGNILDSYLITNTGKIQTNSDSINIFIIFIIILSSSLFFSFVTYVSNNQFIKSIFIGLAGFSITIMIFTGMTISFNFLQEYEGIFTSYNAFFYIFTIVLLVAVFTVIIWVLVRTIERMYKMRGREYDD